MGSEFSRAKKNGLVIHVDSLDPITDKGLACGCVCSKCGKVVQFVYRKIPFKTKFFRHHETSTCTGGPMTALHLSAQQILSEINSFLMVHEEVKYSQSSLEYTFANYRADVRSIQDNLIPVIFEVVVKSDLTEEKILFLKENKIESIRFDLTKVSPNINDTDLTELLRNNAEIKSNIYREAVHNVAVQEVAPIEEKTDDGNSGGFIALIIAIVAAILFWPSGKNKKKHIPYRKRRR
jgi:hypothetical protein